MRKHEEGESKFITHEAYAEASDEDSELELSEKWALNKLLFLNSLYYSSTTKSLCVSQYRCRETDKDEDEYDELLRAALEALNELDRYVYINMENVQ